MNSKIGSMRKFFLLLVFQIVLVATTLQAQSPAAVRYASGQVDLNDPTRVDVALVLAVDVSSSIKSHERRFQREAYAAALSDLRVANIALGGGAGRIAIAYMEWSGRRFQRVLLPMRVMTSPAELAEFAHDILSIEDQTNDPMFVQPTAVGDALLAAEAVMAALPVRAAEYIIDISGDGVVNDGSAVVAAREHLLSLGLTVNGLPIEVTGEVPEHEDVSHDRVARFYADCVIGGPGAFHLIARGFTDVRETLIMKLMLEMAQMTPMRKRQIAMAWNGGSIETHLPVVPATVLQIAPPASPPRPATDCGDGTHFGRVPTGAIR